MTELVRRASRRLNPTRVIVGEILGDEVGRPLRDELDEARGFGEELSKDR